MKWGGVPDQPVNQFNVSHCILLYICIDIGCFSPDITNASNSVTLVKEAEAPTIMPASNPVMSLKEVEAPAIPESNEDHLQKNTTPASNLVTSLKEVEAPAIPEYNEEHLQENSVPTKNRQCSKSVFDLKLDSILNTPVDRPLDLYENKIFTNLTRRALFQSQNGTATVKTGGQPIMLVHVRKHRVESDKASDRTIRNRTRKSYDIHRLSSGKSAESIAKQQGHEFKRIKGNSLDIFYKTAGIENKKMSALEVLAMKESSDMTWCALRKQRRFLKATGMTLPSEASIRKAMHTETLYCTDVDTSMEMFVDKEGHPTRSAFGRVSNISKLVVDMLGKYEDEDKLTWHDDTIPHDEIWVKFGGDHGKGSMKYTMQVANTYKPNSKDNTFVVGKTDTKDNHTNISKCMSFLWPQLEELIRGQWKGKKMVLFIFGDYEFQTKLFGLSGAAGVHPCLWCHATKQDIQLGHTSTPRSLQDIIDEHDRFCSEGNQNKKHVMDYHNCLHPPMVNIDTSAVAPPYLHLLLGIILKHHRELEAEVYELLDQPLCNQPKLGGCYNGYPTHTSHGGNWERARSLKIEMAEKVSLAFWLDIEAGDKGQVERNLMQESLREVEMDIDNLETKLSNLKHKSLKKRKGPVCLELDRILFANGIIPQVYHSRSFIGNHCHRYLTEDANDVTVFEKLTMQVVKTVSECTSDPAMHARARGIQSKFNALNHAYKKVHSAISHTKPIPADDIPAIQKSISTYMEIWRTAFQDTSISPKQHILEMHCVPWIQRYGFGMGLMGEQGGELIHATVAKLERRTRAIRNPEKRLKLMMKTQHLQCCPTLNSLEPPKKKRRTK